MAGNKLANGRSTVLTSVVSRMVSGTPATIGLSTVRGRISQEAATANGVNVVGNPNANGSTFSAWFTRRQFAVPGKGDPATRQEQRPYPGVNNVDLALQKKFPFNGRESVSPVRWEAYNAFNHTQYSSLDLAPNRLDHRAQTNARFGQVISTRAPRSWQGRFDSHSKPSPGTPGVESPLRRC